MKKKKPFYFRSWFINALRRASRRFPPHYEVENKNKEVYYIDSKNGKKLKRVRFTCKKCGNKVNSKEKVRDHIVPVVPPEGFPILSNGEDDWGTYIKRMMCPSDNMQILCKPCHKIKCDIENSERKTIRDSKKPLDSKRKKKIV